MKIYGEQQPKLDKEEKQKMYSESIDYYSAKFSIQNFQVIRLLIGGKGTIPKFIQDGHKEQT